MKKISVNPSGSTDYKWEPGQWKATMTEGLSFNQYLVASEKIKEKGLDFFQLVLDDNKRKQL